MTLDTSTSRRLKNKVTNRQTDKQTNKQKNKVTLLLLELLVAAINRYKICEISLVKLGQ